MAPTIRPLPLSGSSLMPIAGQFDQQTGLVEFTVPQAIMVWSDSLYLESHRKERHGHCRQSQR